MGVLIEPLLWEGGGREEPDVPSFRSRISGSGAQYEIDKVLSDVGGCDIYVGMIWHRMGTPTGEYKSGTEAEYRGAVRERGTGDRPEILFYRKTADLPHDVEPMQLAAAQEFASEIEETGLMQRFEDEQDLESQLHAHLPQAIREVRPELFPAVRMATRTSQTATQAADFAHPYPLQPNFTGRISERMALTDWLAADEQPLFALIARGGMGKSALAWAWLLRDALGLPLPSAATDTPEDAEACRMSEDSRPEGTFWWSFYERDSTFEGFLDRALAYAAGGEIPPGVEGAYEKMEALVGQLREKRLLLVLDGFERQLRRYSSMDAVYQKDEEDGDIPARERACTDPNAATFLRNLAGGPFRSHVLLTSRLFPMELEGPLGAVVANCHRMDLVSLSLEDATAFFHAQNVKGSRSEIEAASRLSGYRPLALRLLTGVTAKDEELPGDVQATERHASLRAPPGERLDAMLKLSYDELGDEGQDLLSKIAAFRSPADYEAVSVLDDFTKDGEFQAALDDLTDRGLLLRDTTQGPFDLHPLVRDYAYERLEDKVSVHERLAEYFATLPVPKDEDVKRVEDLAPVIELYYHTVGAGRYEDAGGLLASRLIPTPLFYRLGAVHFCIELLRVLVPDGDEQLIRLKMPGNQSWALASLATCYHACGEARLSVPLLEPAIAIDEERGETRGMELVLGNRALQQFTLGGLAAAESDLRKSIDLARELRKEFGEVVSHVELGRVLAYEGQYQEAKLELLEAGAYSQRTGDSQGACLVESYRALGTLLEGDPKDALVSSRKARQLATDGAERGRSNERNVVRAEWLIGAALVALTTGGSAERDERLVEAETHLTEALNRCRRINLVAWARWNRAKGDSEEARAQADEALKIADRCEHRLQQADVHNFLAALEMEDDPDAAIEHAQKAFDYAVCDGTPHVYKPALDEAERLLKALGVEPPEVPAYEGD